MQEKKKISFSTIFNVSIIVISLIVLAVFALSENGITDLVKNLETMSISWLIASVICNLVNLLADTTLVYMITKQSVKNFKFTVAFKASMIGQFFSAITPFSTGGQPMQIYYMAKNDIPPGTATSMFVQKFLVYQTTLTTYSAFAMILLFNYFGQTMNSLILSFSIFGFATQAFVIVMLLLFSFNKKITHFLIVGTAKLVSKIPPLRKLEDKIVDLESQLEVFHKSNKELLKDRKLLVKSYALTVIQLSGMFLIPYCIYRSFNLSGASPIDMICSQAFVTMTSCFMPLPGAAGASELSFMGFFSSYFTAETLKSAVLLWRVITYYALILFTAPFSRLTKANPDPEEIAA